MTRPPTDSQPTHKASGYVKLYRSQCRESDPLWKHGVETGDWLPWVTWNYLLTITHYDDEPGAVITRAGVVGVSRGEFCTGQAKLAEKLGVTRQIVRTVLGWLKKLGRIQPTSQPRVTHCKVIKFGTYNDASPERNQAANPRATTEQPQSNQAATHSNKEEHEKGIEGTTPLTPLEGGTVYTRLLTAVVARKVTECRAFDNPWRVSTGGRNRDPHITAMCLLGSSTEPIHIHNDAELDDFNGTDWR